MSTQNFRHCASGRADIMAVWNNVCDNMDREESEWIAELRKRGVKAAHPNDGWVDREKNIVTLCYPQFDDGAQVGDLMVLGWSGKDDYAKNRLVRLTKEAKPGMFSITKTKKFYFEDVKP